MAHSYVASLTTLPPELLLLIRAYLKECYLSCLAKTNRRLCEVFNPILWESARAGVLRATLLNNADAVRKFIGIGASVDRRPGRGELSPLHIAAYEGNASIVEMLLDAGAAMGVVRPDIYPPHNPFAIATCEGHQEVFYIFI